MYETDGVTTVRCPNSFCKIPHIVDGKSGSPDIGCLMATQMSGSSTLREVCPRGSPSMPPPITIPSGRPMGAASSSPPIETASVTYIGNYPAALEPMSCCWNRNQNKSPAHWSSDGRFLLFRSIDPQTGTDLWVMPLSSDKKPFPFLKTSFEEREGQFSPDGKWIAYQSNESSQFEIYVQPFPSNLCSCWDRAGSFRSPLTVARSRAGTGMARKSSTSRWTAR